MKELENGAGSTELVQGRLGPARRQWPGQWAMGCTCGAGRMWCRQVGFDVNIIEGTFGKRTVSLISPANSQHILV